MRRKEQMSNKCVMNWAAATGRHIVETIFALVFLSARALVEVGAPLGKAVVFCGKVTTKFRRFLSPREISEDRANVPCIPCC